MKKIILMLLIAVGFAGVASAQDTVKGKKSPEQKAEHMTEMLHKKLKLTADQIKQVNSILTERATKMETKESRVAKMRALKDADDKIEAVLTEDQKKVYAEIKEKNKEKMKSRRKATTDPVIMPN